MSIFPQWYAEERPSKKASWKRQDGGEDLGSEKPSGVRPWPVEAGTESWGLGIGCRMTAA